MDQPKINLSELINKEIDITFRDIKAKPLTKADIEASLLRTILRDKIGDVFNQYNWGEIGAFLIGFIGVLASLYSGNLSHEWKLVVAILCFCFGIALILIPHYLRKSNDTINPLLDRIEEEVSYFQENHIRIGDAIKEQDEKMDEMIDSLGDAYKKTKRKKRRIHHNHRKRHK